MSLINQVLKDLESRKNGAVAASGPAHVRPIFNQADENKAKGRKRFYGVLALSFLMLFMAGWFFNQKQKGPLTGSSIQVVFQPMGQLSASNEAEWVPELPEPSFSLDTGQGILSIPISVASPEETDTRLEKPLLTEALPKLPPLDAHNLILADVPAAKPGMLKETKTPETRSKAIFTKGQSLLKRGQLPEAVAAFEESLSVWPLNHQAREAIIWVHMRYRMWLQAEQKLTQAIALFPNEIRYFTLKARLLIEQKQPEVALSVLNSQTPALVESTDFYALKAALLQELGQPAKAAELYQALTAYNPGQGAWQMGLGLALEQTGRFSSAIVAYQSALESKALSPESERYVEKRVRLLQAS